MPATTFRTMMDLDTVTSRGLQNGKNGLGEGMRRISIDETDHEDYWMTQIPEYFDDDDVKKPSEVYVKDKLSGIIQEAFDVRRKLEKSMSRRELVAFDRVLMRYLKKDNLEPRLRDAIKEDYNRIYQSRQHHRRMKDLEQDEETQTMKFEHTQREYNAAIKDPDAQFK